MTSRRRLLVDYENVQKLPIGKLPDDIDVAIFLGNGQKSIPLELVLGTQGLGARVEWIKVEGNGSNALDFHFAYYLGKWLARSPRVEHVILSRDKGFDPLVAHLTALGHRCQRVEEIADLEAPAATPPAGKSPAARASAAKSPAAKTPAAKSPAAKTPAAKSPAAKTPAAKRPATQSPATQSTAAQSSAATPQVEKPIPAQSPVAKAAKSRAAKSTVATSAAAVDSDPNYQRVVEVLGKTLQPARPGKRESLTQHVASICGNKLPAGEVAQLVARLFAEGKVTEVNDRLSYSF